MAANRPQMSPLTFQLDADSRQQLTEQIVTMFATSLESLKTSITNLVNRAEQREAKLNEKLTELGQKVDTLQAEVQALKDAAETPTEDQILEADVDKGIADVISVTDGLLPVA